MQKQKEKEGPPPTNGGSDFVFTQIKPPDTSGVLQKIKKALKKEEEAKVERVRNCGQCF